MTRIVRFAMFAAAVAALTTSSMAQGDGEFGPFLPEEQGGRAPAKYCSVFVPNDWRDTFPVPSSWSYRDCQDFATTVGASHVTVMCVFSEGLPAFSFGSDRPPVPDCGWGRRRGSRDGDRPRRRR